MGVNIIMQGPISPGTYEYAQSYTTFPYLDKVIISTWEGQPTLESTDKIKVIYTPDIENPGQNNRNRQIVSTQQGLKHCTATTIIKSRSDQHIRPHALTEMYDYFMKNNQIEEQFLDESGPEGPIFVLNLYTRFVFHPEDHLFMGWQWDIRKLFDLPLDPIYPVNMENPGDNAGVYSDWAHKDTRPNAYIGMYYYARFNKRIQHMVENYKDYIVDEAPFREEALELDRKYRDKIFKAFPKLDIWWQKYNRDWPYDWTSVFTGYHA